MSCTLNKFKVYNLNNVRHDRSTGSYSVEIANPPAACPDGAFSSKNAKLVVNYGTSPNIAFDLNANRPIISVPSTGFVVEYGNGFGFMDFLLIGAGAVALILAARWVYRKLTEDTTTTAYSPYTPSYAGSSAGSSVGSSSGVAPVQGGQPTTIVNNVGGNSGPDLLTTMLVADALSSHNHGGNNTTTIIEHDRVIEHDRDTSSSDDDSDDDSSSSSSNDSYSSDSSSDDSYSSSSSSDDSYSSSSSSDSYSSDSGSSFDSGSSDSGSFSSD